LIIAKAVKRLLKRILWRISPNTVYRLIPEGRNLFSIGILSGESPFDLKGAAMDTNPVLIREDISVAPAGTVADPFMINVRDRWYMFFEITNQFTNKGEIALATSRDAISWQFEKIVLAEPYHMSYPYVFEWQGDYYMIPETGRAKSVRLYRAGNFPYDWTCVATLLDGSRFSDSSIFRFENRWWLFTDAGADAGSPLLRLFFASDLFGPWTEHPRSPIAGGDPHISRPGGRVVIVDGNPIRFTQNVYPVYGTEVRAFEICELSTTAYREKQVGDEPIIGPGSEPWNRYGMHHIDPHRLEDGSWLACVDGCIRRNSAGSRDPAA